MLGVVGGPASTFNPYSYVRGNTVNLTDPSGRFADSNLWDLFSRIGETVIDFFTHNEGARQILDSLGICPDELSDGIRGLTGEMDRIFNEVAERPFEYSTSDQICC